MITRDSLIALDKETLIELILKLSMRVGGLEARLNKNSSNSSKPPSSDGFEKKNKPNPKSLRGRSGKNSGGQDGHKGGTLKQVITPDIVIIHTPSNCNVCKADLSAVSTTMIQKRQVFDIPKPAIEVIEHIQESKCCPNCAHVNKGQFPESVTAPVQYGSRIKAMAIYMMYQNFIPEDRLAKTFSDLYGINICPATLVTSSRLLYENLEEYEVKTEEFLANSNLVHFDESGMRVEGKLNWLHSAGNKDAVIYKIHKKRGSEAMKEFYVHSNFKGIAVHDHWKPYFSLQTLLHSLCNSHILRELLGIYESHDIAWANEMMQFLYKTYKYVETHRIEGSLPKTYQEMLKTEYNEILLKANKYYDKQINIKKSPGRSLFIRMRDFDAEILRFMYDFDVPFSNNVAEQDIRMCKLRQKISGTFRSIAGSKVFCRIRGYITTARKQGINIFSAIESGLSGNPFTAQ